MKATERKRRREESTHRQEIEVIDNQKFPVSYQSYLRNSNNKTHLAKYLFQKRRETLPNVLTSSQIIYLEHLDGATDRVTSQSSEGIGFYYDHEEADSKMVVYIKSLCDNICLNRVIFVSPDGDVAVISLYQSVTNLTFLNALWLKTGTGDDQRYIPINVLALMLLASCNACRM